MSSKERVCQACHPKGWHKQDEDAGTTKGLATWVYSGQTQRGPAYFCDRHTVGTALLDDRPRVWAKIFREPGAEVVP